MKTCSKCHEEKPISEYPVNRSRKDGHQTWCRACGRRRYRSERGPRPPIPRRYLLDEATLRHLRAAVGLPPEGPTDEHRDRWHAQEMQGVRK